MIWDKNMATKKHNEKAGWIYNITRGLEGLKEGPKAEIYSKRQLKRYQMGKRLAMMEYMVSGSRSSPSIHDTLALEKIKCLHTAHVTE